jgi:hypothetical protein
MVVNEVARLLLVTLLLGGIPDVMLNVWGRLLAEV